LLLVIPALGALVALDSGLRWVGYYTSTGATWPAGWRRVPPDRRQPSPYREGSRGEWVLVVEAGVPRAVSVFLPLVFGITLLWTLATALALGDLADVVRGTRPLAFVLASLSLCAIRALTGGAALFAASEGWTSLFFLASGLGVGHDAALALFALPCSDIRADDIRMALASGAAQVVLMLGFALSMWRRRHLVASACPSVAPAARCGSGEW
jgi:hypothetical protein